MKGMAKSYYYTAVVLTTTFVFGTLVLTSRKDFQMLKVKSSNETGYTIPENTSTPRFSNINVTIVSAYFDIGSFRKGSSKTFQPSFYMNWAKVFAYIVNPIVIYTDSDGYIELMKKIRENLKNKTLIIKTERNSTWSFQMVEAIRKIYSASGYPVHHPNTVVPEYSSAMHAKYELLANTVRSNPFNTTYFAWLDVGYFRDIIGEKKPFVVDLPPGFNESCLAVNHLRTMDMNLPPDKIIRGNLVWVSGGFQIGRSDVIISFEEDYRKAQNYLMSQNLTSTDQQVIFFMYSTQGKELVHPKTQLQLYQPTGYSNIWFALGFKCRKMGIT